MSPKYFVEIVRKVVQEQAVRDSIENLQEPPGREPDNALLRFSDFYNKLSDDQKVILEKILHQTAEMTLFGMLCVIDGVRTIESGEDKGNLELWYRRGDETVLLNDPEEEFLHDLL